VYRFDVPIRLVGVLAVAGVVLVVWSALWFRRVQTPLDPRDTPTALVVEGPYRINRNPIYTGMTVVLLALALYLGAVSALISVVIFPLIIDLRFVRREERVLRAVTHKPRTAS